MDITRVQRSEHSRAYMREYMRARRARASRSWFVKTGNGKRVRVILLFEKGEVELCGGSDAVEKMAGMLRLRGVGCRGPLSASCPVDARSLARLQANLEELTARGEAWPASGTALKCRRRVPRGSS